MTDRDRSIWLFGQHSCLAAIKSKDRAIYEIILTEKIFNINKEIFVNLDLLNKIKIATKADIQNVVETQESIIIRCSKKPRYSINSLLERIDNESKERDCIVILDKLNDVNNIGAILRTCAAFNVSKIIVPTNGFPEETSAMVKSAAGNFELLNIYEAGNISDVIKLLKSRNYWVAGLDGESKANIKNIENFEKIGLVLGSEGKGIRPLIKRNCDILLNISINKNVESLNASNAAAIALYEINRSK